MKEIVKLSLTLALVCIVSAASLSFVFRHTEPIIEQKRKQKLTESLKEVLGISKEKVEEVKSGKLFETLKSKLELEALYRGKRPNGTVVYAASVSVGGYQGPIKLLVGFEPNKSVVLGVKILEHSETPGLGARIAEHKKNQKNFLDGLEGKLKARNQYDTITGATISSQAVINGVVSVLKYSLESINKK